MASKTNKGLLRKLKICWSTQCSLSRLVLGYPQRGTTKWLSTEYFKTRLLDLKRSRGFPKHEQALRTIGVQDRNDPLTQLIAKKVIEIGQTGLKDPAEICGRAVEELGLPEG